jgi:hypothetical protein
MKDLEFEIGQWVGTEDGYGQIIYIRPYFVEDYENDRKGRKNGEFIQFIYICKILCDFNGKIRKSKRINIYTSVEPIDQKGLSFLNKIKTTQNSEYIKYILFEDKVSIHQQLFIKYKISKDNFEIEIVEKQIKEINKRLYPAFTYKEFINIFQEYDFPFKVEDILPYGHVNRNCLELRFDSNLYKVKDKQVIFDNVILVR